MMPLAEMTQPLQTCPSQMPPPDLRWWFLGANWEPEATPFWRDRCPEPCEPTREMYS